MIFDHIEWDDHNLDHATKRLTFAEIEQALANAERWFRHHSIEDRRLVRSRTDGGKSVLVVVQVVRDGYDPSPDGRNEMTESMTEAELAEHYESTRDTSDFELGRSEPVTVKRNVTISVRFSSEEIEDLRVRAEKEGVKVTAFIRDAALEASSPVDRAALRELAREMEQRAHDLANLMAKGA